MKKRILIMLTVFTALFLFGAVSANAEIVDSGSCGVNVTYTLDREGKLTISGTGAMTDYRSAYDTPFSLYSKSIRTVIIENGVANIGNCAFSGFSGLTSVSIAESVTSIGEYGFSSCTALDSITLPDSITNIGRDAFGNTGYYNNSYNWDEGVLYIGKYLIGAKSAEIPVNYAVKSDTCVIAARAFANCSDLISITIPNGIKKLDDNTFRGCSKLSDITIPESITEIGSGAFYDCLNLKEINIPNGVTVFGTAVFRFSGITDITLPENMTEIPDDFFYGASSLKSLVIPNGVKSIGEYAFFGCSKLEDVYYTGGEEQWNGIDISSLYNDNLVNASIHYNSIGPNIPLTTINVTKTDTDTEWQFDVEVGETYLYSYVYTVIYDEDGAIDNIVRVPLETNGVTTITAPKSATDKTAKIFVWTSKMQPITEAESVDL